MYDRSDIKAMRPAEAFLALQGLRGRLQAATDLDADTLDPTMALLEQQLVKGVVRGAEDVMAIAQHVHAEQRADGAMVNPELLPALIAGLSAITGVQPLHAA